MKFFKPDGAEISKDKFVSFYSDVYYYLYRDLELEDTVRNILKKDNLTAENIVDILRWKIGAIKFNYQDNSVTNQWYTINAGELIAEIQGVKKVNEPVSETLKELMKHEHIGSVYAITLLHFLSKGTYPIYDKFAHIAIKVIEEELPFKTMIEDKVLEKEFSTGAVDAEKIFRSYQDKYVARLNNVFGDVYKEDCNIDRALWVYGHLFSDTKMNQQRIGKAATTLLRWTEVRTALTGSSSTPAAGIWAWRLLPGIRTKRSASVPRGLLMSWSGPPGS